MQVDTRLHWLKAKRVKKLSSLAQEDECEIVRSFIDNLDMFTWLEALSVISSKEFSECSSACQNACFAGMLEYFKKESK